MTALRALHATRNAAGLSEDEARDIYERVTDQRSTRAMNGDQLKRARLEIIRLYPASGKRTSNGSRKRLTGKYAKKFQALWIAAWNLGIVKDNSDTALIKFVKRQSGIDHTAWLNEAEDMNKVVEALKSWMAREAGVDWSKASKYDFAYMHQLGFRIAKAQWRVLCKRANAHPEDFWSAVGDFLNHDPSLVSGLITDAQWIIVMNALGREIREAKK